MRLVVLFLMVVASMSGFGQSADLTMNLPGGVTMDFNYIPPGTFMMGSPVGEPGREVNEDLHEVTLTEGYYLGVTEVTQGQWEAVTGTPMPSSCGSFGVGPDYPVYCVSWDDIAQPGGFVELLNDYLTATSQPGASLLRLPTEAEWERAARGETQTEFSFAVPPGWDTGCGTFPEAEPYMVWCGNDNGQVEIVGSTDSNPYGLRDMHGNLLEWVEDWYEQNLGFDPVVDPPGPDTGWSVVIRGGAFTTFASNCRSAYRNFGFPSERYGYAGFRLAWSVDSVVFSDSFETGDTSAWSTPVP